jgi:hypothetical protein
MTGTAPVAQGREHIVQRMLGAVRHHDLLRTVLQTVRGLVLAGDGRAQLGDAASDGVVGVAGPHGVDGGLANVVGRSEIGLANAEVVNFFSRGLELLGFGGHGQRGRGFQSLHDPRNRRRHRRNSRLRKRGG